MGISTPQDEASDGIGALCLCESVPVAREFARRRRVGCEQHTKRSALADLGSELAGGAERDEGAMTTLALEFACE